MACGFKGASAGGGVGVDCSGVGSAMASVRDLQLVELSSLMIIAFSSLKVSADVRLTVGCAWPSHKASSSTVDRSGDRRGESAPYDRSTSRARKANVSREGPPKVPDGQTLTHGTEVRNASVGLESRKIEVPPEVTAIIEDGAKAWKPFLECYSPFILACIRRFAADYDERMEIYVHVCQRLAADECRRIRQYRGSGDAGACRFSTWLAAVVYNLAREWIRSAKGRRRMFRVVRDMDRADRLVFRYYFWDGYTIGQIAALLQTRENLRCRPRQVLDRLGFIERRLSKDHRWRLVTSLLRSVTPLSLDQPRSFVREDAPFELPDTRIDPLSVVERERAVTVLRRLLRELPKEERRALQLRFGRGQTARTVARALGLRNYKRVYEIQSRALAKLEAGLRDRGVELGDFVAGPPGSLDILK